MKKILITYASAGDGHKKAAEAIYRQFLDVASDAEIVFVDSLNYATRSFKFSYRRIYIILIKYMPWLWGFFYHLLNNRFFFFVARPFRILVNTINSKKLINFLLKEQFDIIISTHFFATEVISRYKEKSVLPAPLINIVTDFKAHLYWIGKNVDKYVVASESLIHEFVNRGVDFKKIAVLGVPVRKKFSIPVSKETVRKELKLSKEKFTLLVMGGGLGVGPIKEVVLDLQRLDFDCQIIVVCGHNKALVKELETMSDNFAKDTRIIGFSHSVDMLMAASDIMISKAGGVTVSESLARELPIICIKPIPGQESGNAQFLLDHHIGFWLKDYCDINDTVSKLYYFADNTDKLKKEIVKLARPDSAKNIAELALEMIR